MKVIRQGKCDRIHTLKLNLLFGPTHFRCESVGLKLMKPGTDSTDSECGQHGSERGHVAGIIPGVILALMALIIAIVLRKKKGRKEVGG